MTIALLAALAMLAQDIISVPLTMAEARNKAHLAGILDTIGWLVAISTTFLSVNALQGHNLHLKIMVITGVSISNYFGTVLGVKLGKRFVHEESTKLSKSL